MPSYLLSLNVPAGRYDRHTVDAECIHTEGDYTAFRDADHDLVYAVRTEALLAIKRLPNPDRDIEEAAMSAATSEPDVADEAPARGRLASDVIRQLIDDWEHQQLVSGRPHPMFVEVVGTMNSGAGLSETMRRASEAAAEAGRPFGVRW